MNHKLKYAFAAALMGVTGSLFAKENVTSGIVNSQNQSPSFAIAAACQPATAQTDLDVNNVRTTILAGGDMWWDLDNGVYEIPKGSNKHSLFAGSLWIGGIDDGSNLKVAAMTYRQTGNDFWPGPLNPANASTDITICDQYDTHFSITKPEVAPVAAYSQELDAGGSPEVPTFTSVVENWPAQSPWGEPLAPFYDRSGDGSYDPSDGDYPAYDFSGGSCNNDLLYGDKTLWWVFNDKGNIHTESGAEAIGLEIQAQAFGFATNDEINNMTFYQYKIINRSSFAVNDCYFGQWVDPDLGQYQDDYVGCDVERGLGYCYNGDNDDEGATGYGINPPCIGVDFFQGPIADANDGIDNDRDQTVDEPGEQIIMAKYVYYNNVNAQPDGNPETGADFYNYLQGVWLDGIPITYGGDGRDPNNPTCDFMFPGDSDQEFGWGLGGGPGNPQILPPWTEASVGNTPADRRFLQSAGSFTLQPGAVNYITTGVVWARTTTGGALASVDLARVADDKAQALFDNCFKVVEGPDAPDVTIQELNREIVLLISNDNPISNNYKESYEEVDPLIICPATDPNCDRTYNFEGYQIYQFRDATVTAADIGNSDLVRLAAQCDIKNGVKNLVNFEFDQSLNANVPTQMVSGEDAGVRHSFSIKQDLFASGDARLVNNKPYYFYVVAYAHNNFKDYDQNDPLALDGQKKPYLASRKLGSTGLAIPVNEGIPHDPIAEAGGTVQNSEYGDGPKITRIHGKGNGGNALDITAESEEAIVSNYCLDNVQYENGAGPIEIKVVDPLKVPDTDFNFVIHNSNTDTASWTLTYSIDGNQFIVESDRTTEFKNEQVIANAGISVTLQNVDRPGENNDADNGFISARVDRENPSDNWLGFVEDQEGEFTPNNWIRSGTGNGDIAAVDDQSVYESVLGGTWAPYRLLANNTFDTVTGPAIDFGGGPAWESFQSLNDIKKTPSVYVVFTPDESKWTRVPVVELGENEAETEGNVKKLNLRAGQSVNKKGEPDGSGTGWGWFPGYAIDLESGMRLNMMFGEDSRMTADNGNDMVWNPSSNVFMFDGFPVSALDARNGGRHYIYVMNTRYQGDDQNANPYKSNFESNGGDPTAAQKRSIYADVNWVSMPILNPGFELLSSEIKVVLQVTRPYAKMNDCSGGTSEDPTYTFNTSDLRVEKDNLAAEKNALEKIQVVPNPYYAYSEYETDQLDNRVKITNLPERCTISIFSLSGTLVRKINKDNPQTEIEWDLKNSNLIPIASGVYIIHVDAGDAGERVLKWFGAMRPVDLDSF